MLRAGVPAETLPFHLSDLEPAPLQLRPREGLPAVRAGGHAVQPYEPGEQRSEPGASGLEPA